MPVAPRPSISFSASAASSSGNARADDRLDEAGVDQLVDLGADLDVRLRLAHHVRAPAGADDLDVVEQQAVDRTSGIEPPVKPTTTDAPAVGQRAQAVGEAVAADRVEHDVDARAAGQLLGLVLPGAVGAHDLVGAGLARHALLLVARDDGDRARADALGDLDRRGADAAGRAVDEHASRPRCSRPRVTSENHAVW